MQLFFSVFLFFIFSSAFAQHRSLTELQPKEPFENVYSEKIAEDSLSSSFLIWIKKEVKLHKHLEHSEHVYVLEGEGNMQLGNEKLNIKSGDIIFIPQNTPHKVVTTSKNPLKVVSIQSPKFDGADRILLE
jgi:mannose-6-phosphate isomerase-like protein (cupin superfamily)